MFKKLILALALAIAAPAYADTFTAAYTRLADSPSGSQRSWYGGSVTNDGKFVYGLGHSHNTNGDNSIWLFDPSTATSSQIFANTGGTWRWTTGVAGSGHWLDPALVALSNRNNHQQFYLSRLNQWVVMNGTYWYQEGSLIGGRFDLATKKWVNVSKSWAEFNAGFAVGGNGGMPANAATAVCKDIDTVVFFGGMNGKDTPVKLLKPNTTGSAEPYQWVNLPKPPIYLPAENVRELAACVGDTVYFSTGQQRVEQGAVGESTPNPGPFWKFHVPTRAWTRLPNGPPGGYFPTLTYDSDANALLYYGGGAIGYGSTAMWAYDLVAGKWQDLTDTTAAPQVDMMTAGFLPGFGHVIQGGRVHDKWGAEISGAARRTHRITLTRVGGQPIPEPVPPEPAPAPAPNPTQPPTVPAPAPTPAPTPNYPSCPAGCVPAPVAQPAPAPIQPAPGTVVWVAGTNYTIGQVVLYAPNGNYYKVVNVNSNGTNGTNPTISTWYWALTTVPGTVPAPVPPAQTPIPEPTPTPAGASISWTKIPLPGPPNSPSNVTKHARIAQAGNGRVYFLGGDWGAPGGENTGHQEVYSFDPLSTTGDWRLEAPYCGTVENPTHWHTDEAGVAWDAKRGVFWKLSGTEYGPEDACFLAGKSVKAKVIQFNPTTKLWTVPAGVSQMRFGYVTNGVLDPINDQMVQITDTKAFHLNLSTGKWTEYPLWGEVKRFTALTTRIGREVWFGNQKQFIESYHLDTHALTNHGFPPWRTPEGYGTFMTANVGGKLLVIKATAGPLEERHAGLYDPATKKWAVIDQGDGWGNSATALADGRVVLTGGGINGPQDNNKFVWVGRL